MALSKIKPSSLNITVSSDPSGNIAGRMFYNTTDNQLIIQDGTNSEKQNYGSLGSEVIPASSAKELYDAGITTDGAYYIKNYWTGNVAREVYCEFDFDFRGAGTGYHLQKFDPSHMQNTRYNAGPSSSSLTTVSSADLTDDSSYSWLYSTASSSSGAKSIHKTGQILSDLGQFFMRIDMDPQSNGQSANPRGEPGVAFDSDNSGNSSSINSSYTYVQHFQDFPNSNLDFSSHGFLMPSDCGTAAFDLDDIVAAYATNSGDIDTARSRLASSANSTDYGTPSYQGSGDSITTGLYLDITHMGWSDFSTANSSNFMYWVASEV